LAIPGLKEKRGHRGKKGRRGINRTTGNPTAKYFVSGKKGNPKKRKKGRCTKKNLSISLRVPVGVTLKKGVEKSERGDRKGPLGSGENPHGGGVLKDLGARAEKKKGSAGNRDRGGHKDRAGGVGGGRGKKNLIPEEKNWHRREKASEGGIIDCPCAHLSPTGERVNKGQ